MFALKSVQCGGTHTVKSECFETINRVVTHLPPLSMHLNTQFECFASWRYLDLAVLRSLGLSVW